MLKKSASLFSSFGLFGQSGPSSLSGFWLNETNQMNQINQINKTNQINQMVQPDRGCATRASHRGSRGPATLFRSLLNPTGQQQNDQDQEGQA
jgi:hypothetical protein